MQIAGPSGILLRSPAWVCLDAEIVALATDLLAPLAVGISCQGEGRMGLVGFGFRSAVCSGGRHDDFRTCFRPVTGSTFIVARMSVVVKVVILFATGQRFRAISFVPNNLPP